MMRKTMWMLALIAFLSPAACGNDDDEGSTTSDPTKALTEAKTKIGCSNLSATTATTPKDGCNFGLCTAIQIWEQQSTAAYWGKLGDCISDWLSCYSDYCATLTSTSTIDETKVKKCTDDVMSCVCALPEATGSSQCASAS